VPDAHDPKAKRHEPRTADNRPRPATDPAYEKILSRILKTRISSVDAFARAHLKTDAPRYGPCGKVFA